MKAEAAVPVRQRERVRINNLAAATYLFEQDGACIERDEFH